MQKIISNRQKGTTLLEVIFTIVVIGMVLGALITAVNYGLSNAQYARNKALATKYGQEAVEWLRNERSFLGWSEFYAKACSVSGCAYCVDTLPACPAAGSCCNSPNPPGACWPGSASCTPTQVINDQFDSFHREVTLEQDGVDKVNVQVRVFWQQGNRDSEIELNTYLTRWQ